MIARAGTAIYEALTAQKDRFFLWAPVFLGLGIALYFSLETEPAAGAAPLAAGAILATGVMGRRDPLARALCGFALLTALGFGVAQWRAHEVRTPLLLKEHGPAMVEGTILQIEPQEEGRGSRLILGDLVIEDLEPAATPRRVRLALRADGGLAAGDRIRALAALNPPSGPVMPGAFDFQRYAYFKGIGAVGFIYKAPEVIGAKAGARSVFERMRESIIASVQTHARPPYAAVIVTLLTGHQTAIADDDWQAMRDSGLAHLLSISGMHVVMVAGSLFFLSRLLMAAWPWLALHYPIKKGAAVIALLAAVFYTFTVGAAIPAQRAMMMTAFVMIAILCDRSPFSPRLLALAALVVMLLFPESLMGVSFQMSFAAVAALVLFYDWSRPFWRRLNSQAGTVRKGLLYMAGVLATSVIAGAATGFFSLYHFQNFALYGVLANMIAVPLMGVVVMPASLLSYALMPLGLEEYPLAAMEWGVSWILATAHWTAAMDGAVILVRAWPAVTFALGVCGALFAALWNGRLRWAGLAAAALGLTFIPLHRPPDILIADSFKLIALRGADGDLRVSSGRAERFTAENWQRLNGRAEEKPAVWPREGMVEEAGMTCGPEGCRAVIAGHRIALPRSRAAVPEDCGWAEILLYADPLPRESCAAPRRFDRFDVYRGGAHALWLGGGTVTLRSVLSERGRRPWTGYRYEEEEAGPSRSNITDRSASD